MQIDELLIQNFMEVLGNPAAAGRQKEQVVQEFLEQNTELIPTPNRLNHHLHFQSIVSKFPRQSVGHAPNTLQRIVSGSGVAKLLSVQDHVWRPDSRDDSSALYGGSLIPQSKPTELSGVAVANSVAAVFQFTAPA